MAKGKLLEDTFEQLVELGVSTKKKTVKQVSQTLNPLSSLISTDNQTEKKGSKIGELKKEGNHTPLDFDKLQEKFKDQEKAKQEALRQKLFQMVRQADERILQEQKQKEIEKRRREELEKQEKERRKKEEQARQQQEFIPMGKIRRSIFSAKKVAQRQHIETKASSGKQ